MKKRNVGNRNKPYETVVNYKKPYNTVEKCWILDNFWC